ncbi:cytochrome P450 [Lobosporangium transversale]|uniref:Cytochrome P450 n=1 Tax=Lobosporangium transversale TaxID=64571 RepID=A0A1Y2G9Q1_9FUNG|nr:cytochrome P450 [Lobosporangium transversale]ORZ04879.1 cytochrome P450 [Lobosporangium transversale]|eukprot:XP_021876816.1 cytochrome P450 [Lobosporangium transversale]
MISNAFFHPLAPIPGNKLIASTHLFEGLFFLSGRVHHFFPLAHKLYGKVVRVAPNIVSVADKDMIREILVTTDYPKSAVYQAFDYDGHENLFSARNKSLNKNRRRLVAPAFGLQYLQSLEPLIHKCISSLLQEIDGILDGSRTAKNKTSKALPPGQINIYSFMIRLSLDIIGETIFGQSFEMVKDDAHPVPQQLEKTIKRAMTQALIPWMKYVDPFDSSFLDFGAACVKQRKASGEEGRRADLLQYLIDAQAKEREDSDGESGDEREDMVYGKLTDKVIEVEACVFLIGGADTSSIIMTFTLMFLVKHPDKLSKLRSELDFATATNPYGSLPTYEQIRKLPYLTGCINESMRLNPTITLGIPRDVDEDVVINNYYFPKGTTLFAHPLQLHLSEEYFPQADKYIPERWIPDESPFPPVQDFTYYPFSAGSRNCIGKNLAMMELRLVLAALILTYDMELVPNQREDCVQYLTPSLATGSYIIKMKRRHGAQSSDHRSCVSTY